MDPRAYRKESRERWGAVAEGWAAHRDFQAEQTMPVSTWLVEALELQPGARVLELAAGVGDVGFLAAELIAPGGELITSDFSPEMLTAAQERAQERGVDGVRFKQIDAESIDLETASVDAVICRWAYMLMADPAAALRETRRVLRPGGRVSLAAWAGAEHNRWTAALHEALVARGVLPAPPPDEPGPWSWGEPGTVEEHLLAAGFLDVVVETLDFEFRYGSFEEWLHVMGTFSARSGAALRELPAGDRAEVETALRQESAPFTDDSGAVAFPARTWVAVAEA